MKVGSVIELIPDTAKGCLRPMTCHVVRVEYQSHSGEPRVNDVFHLQEIKERQEKVVERSRRR